MNAMLRVFGAGVLGALTAAGPVQAGETPRPKDASVYIVNLSDGDTVASPVTVIFGLDGMGIAPAGTDAENTGHHHLLLNRAPFGEAPEDDTSAPLLADDNHIHFGGGQTQTTLELEPGSYTLQLLLADMNHIPHDPPLTSEVITITVE